MLLDTQVVLWSVHDDARLGSRARRIMADSTKLYVSAVTHVELTIKTLRGKLGTPADLPVLLAAQGFAPLALEERHVVGLRAFPELERHDPFDRMLAAQALVEGLQLLTSDRALLALDRPWIIDATL